MRDEMGPLCSLPSALSQSTKRNNHKAKRHDEAVWRPAWKCERRKRCTHTSIIIIIFIMIIIITATIMSGTCTYRGPTPMAHSWPPKPRPPPVCCRHHPSEWEYAHTNHLHLKAGHVNQSTKKSRDGSTSNTLTQPQPRLSRAYDWVDVSLRVDM